MLGLVGAATAKINEQPDDQVGEAHQVLIENRPVHGDFRDDHLGDQNLDRAAGDAIVGASPRHQASQDFGDVNGVRDGFSADRDEMVANLNSLGGRYAVRRNVEGFHAACAIHPDHAVFVQAEVVLFVQINEGSDTRSKGQDREDGRR